MNQTIDKMHNLVSTIARSGNPDEDFFYLGGPMTGYPQFNFPAFFEAGDLLRRNGYNIISPAELDDGATQQRAMASPDGKPWTEGDAPGGPVWADFLSRDLIICSLPTCVGGIFLDGWHESRGARLESYVLDRLGKSLYEYETAADGLVTFPWLTAIDRDVTLAYYDSIKKDYAV